LRRDWSRWRNACRALLGSAANAAEVLRQPVEHPPNRSDPSRRQDRVLNAKLLKDTPASGRGWNVVEHGLEASTGRSISCGHSDALVGVNPFIGHVAAKTGAADLVRWRCNGAATTDQPVVRAPDCRNVIGCGFLGWCDRPHETQSPDLRAVARIGGAKHQSVTGSFDHSGRQLLLDVIAHEVAAGKALARLSRSAG